MTACPPSGPAPAAVPAASQGGAVLHGEAIRSLRVATCSVWRWSRVECGGAGGGGHQTWGVFKPQRAATGPKKK